MSTERLPIAVKKSPRSHHAFFTYVLHIVEHIDNNPSFPSPTPSVAKLKKKADAFAQANAKAKNGGPSAVADRDAKRIDLEADVDDLVGYVRRTVRAKAVDPATAAAMILSAGLSIRKVGRAPKPPLAAKYGLVSGEVVLVARAVAKTAVYLWEYSAGEETWTSVPQTLQTSTVIAGLTPGRVYAFRFRAHTRRGTGDYTDAVTLMVL